MSEDNLMPELQLRQTRFTYSSCGSFTIYRERIQRFRETGNLRHLCKNKLNKACFTHDAVYSDSKYLAKRTVSDNKIKFWKIKFTKLQQILNMMDTKED